MAYVMITENLVDQAFLDKYCVGYDEKTLPAGAPKGSDYKSHILGNGPDGTAKTPAWASKQTGIPEDTIVRLAREIATTKPLFVAQGWGPQRRANGDSLCLAVAMLPILTGQLGLPGTNNGAREADQSGFAASLPVPPNPVKAAVCLNCWHRAIYEAEKLTAKNGLCRGTDALKQNIKFMWETQGNNVINQHSGSNLMSKLLRDPKLIECFVVVDTQMTPTAKFADYVLPDVTGQENNDFSGDSYSVGGHCYLIAMEKAVEPAYGQMRNWDIMREMAKRFGVEDKYTEGKTYDQWLMQCYENSRKKIPALPESYADFVKMGVVKYKVAADSGITMENFRRDPEKFPIRTPSGKIEIYSERLAKLAATAELPDHIGQVIRPIPTYIPTHEMAGHDPLEKKYPLECYGYHGQGHVHSSYANLPWIQELQPDLLLINPVDADKRGIKTGSRVLVENGRGKLHIRAKVTPRIIPGLVALPQGAWYRPDPKTGIDEGACINTLTSSIVSPIAKGSPMHNNLVEVTLA
jgi:DmsA/YnfE family anaerobic dimethyl sulfoxide reductase A subunit